MTGAIIITLCILVLIAYIFDITSSRTKVPSVILLLVMGWLVKQIAILLDLHIPDLSFILPLLGTVGLILIVLEGSLELELDKTKIPLLKKSTIVSLIPLLVMAFLLAGVFCMNGGYSIKYCLANAIPLCIISSAIAIPSVQNLSSENKEFVIYESSLSDIIGVIFFNFIVLHESFGFHTFATFFFDLIIIAIISFVSTIGLSFLLSKIGHHIKFIPITMLVILIYTISKEYHLPALIFILVFGLFLGNLDELKGLTWLDKIKPEQLNIEVQKFKDLTGEAAFLVRTLFFILFGYLIEASEVLNTDTLLWAGGIVAGIFLIRALTLRILKMDIMPLLFVAPRGLITILLFLSIPETHALPFVTRSLVIQVILLTALVMMGGLMFERRKTLKPD